MKTIEWQHEPKGPGHRAVHMFIDADDERVELLAYDVPASKFHPRLCGFEVFGRIRDAGPFDRQLAAGKSQSLEEAKRDARAMVELPRALWTKLPTA